MSVNISTIIYTSRATNTTSPAWGTITTGNLFTYQSPVSYYIWNESGAEANAAPFLPIIFLYTYNNTTDSNISAVLTLIADDYCKWFLNGSQVNTSTSYGWPSAGFTGGVPTNITLVPGKNKFVFCCYNGGGPAGFVAQCVANSAVLFNTNDTNTGWSIFDTFNISGNPISNYLMPFRVDVNSNSANQTIGYKLNDVDIGQLFCSSAFKSSFNNPNVSATTNYKYNSIDISNNFISIAASLIQVVVTSSDYLSTTYTIGGIIYNALIFQSGNFTITGIKNLYQIFAVGSGNPGVGLTQFANTGGNGGQVSGYNVNADPIVSNSYVTLNTNTITGSVGSGLAFQGTASSSNNSVVNISNPPTGLSSTYTATCGGGASTTIGSPSINGAPGTLNNYTGNYYGGRGGNGSNGEGSGTGSVGGTGGLGGGGGGGASTYNNSQGNPGGNGGGVTGTAGSGGAGGIAGRLNGGNGGNGTASQYGGGGGGAANTRENTAGFGGNGGTNGGLGGTGTGLNGNDYGNGLPGNGGGGGGGFGGGGGGGGCSEPRSTNIPASNNGGGGGGGTVIIIYRN